jgi:monoamine oxidase
VVVLEARDRIGGRTFTEVRGDGLYLDHGGTWIGPGQDAIYGLMTEFGIRSFKQFTDGDAMMFVDGKKYRYGGSIPWTMSPWASANLSIAFLELGRMCKTIPVEAPWTAAKAQKWDRTTLAQWLGANVPAKQAHQLLEMAIAGTYTSAASEISLLFALAQMPSAGGPHDVAYGVLTIVNEGPDARKLTAMNPAHRKTALLAAIAQRFGPKAATPIGFAEQDWTVERYSGGGMISHAPPGVLTQFGHALRPPCGRVHWAGTESSTVMMGFVDGAVRSGERAAAEVLAA